LNFLTIEAKYFMNVKTCYMCDEPSTSVEHVPPKCLFPEKKDLSPEEQTLDLKRQLITVPSCHEHNGQKSTDDEYLLCLLAISLLSGKNGQQQGVTKVKRILERKPALKAKITEKMTPLLVQDIHTGQVNETFALEIERNRIESSLESCARALYFNQFNHKFVGDVLVIPLFLSDLDAKFNQSVEQLHHNTEILFSNIQPQGENPSIFTYKFHVEEGNGNTRLEMTFYEGARAVAIFKSSSTAA